MAIDLIRNIDGFGDAVDRLIANEWDTGVLRPFKGRDGRNYVTRMIDNGRGVKVPRAFVTNTPATLSRDAWMLFDQTVIRTLQERLAIVKDIRGAGLEFRLPNGMAHTVLQYQTVGDFSRATISMDPVRRSEGDRPEVDQGFLPLPIIHKDFDLSAREVAASRLGAVSLDTTSAELAALAVAEELEMLATGTSGSYSYGGGTIYGLTNLPSRATKNDMTVPTGANGTTVVSEFLALRQLLINNKHFGPYRVYVNSQWSQFLDADFSTAKGDATLRQRLLAIDGIQSIATLDFLPTTNWNVAMLEMKNTTARMVIGMEVQTVQWESVGGFMKHYKVMCLQVPQFRADTNGQSGVAHGKSATP